MPPKNTNTTPEPASPHVAALCLTPTEAVRQGMEDEDAAKIAQEERGKLLWIQLRRCLLSAVALVDAYYGIREKQNR